MMIQMLYGTIDPNWVLTGAVTIALFLLVRILNRIEKRLEMHDNMLNEQGKELAVLKSRQNGSSNGKQ